MFVSELMPGSDSLIVFVIMFNFSYHRDSCIEACKQHYKSQMILNFPYFVFLSFFILTPTLFFLNIDLF